MLQFGVNRFFCLLLSERVRSDAPPGLYCRALGTVMGYTAQFLICLWSAMLLVLTCCLLSLSPCDVSQGRYGASWQLLARITVISPGTHPGSLSSLFPPLFLISFFTHAHSIKIPNSKTVIPPFSAVCSETNSLWWKLSGLKFTRLVIRKGVFSIHIIQKSGLFI